MSVITTETADVYRAFGRRWLTKHAAYRAAARERLAHACCCEDALDGVCRYHNQAYRDLVLTRLARWYRFLDRIDTRQNSV